MTKQQKHAVIIGAGVGGMATAIRLATNGVKTTVYETQPEPGGKLSAFSSGPYHFDAGPSLFTAPQLLEELFVTAGAKPEDYFTTQRVDPICNYFFSDGTQFDAPADIDLLAATAGKTFGEDSSKIKRYLAAAAERYNSIGKLFLEHSLHKPRIFPWRKVPKALSKTRPGLLFQSMHKHNSSAFSSKNLTQLFDRYATYNGSNPYKAPALLTMIPHLEMNEGTYYPDGGMISITNALYNLAKDVGVKFLFGTPVQRIIHHGTEVLGVVVDEENIKADFVVSNADAFFTYHTLLRNKREAAKILKQERSSSAVIFYWGIAQQFPQLSLHNIFFSSNYHDEFKNLFSRHAFASDPTIYVNITGKLSPGHAPAHHENWFVMVNAPANVGQNWDELVKELRPRVLDRLSRVLNTEIEALIQTEVVRDPRHIEQQTQSYMGSLYGTSSNSRLAAFLRHPNFSRQMNGLYFVGGSVHPGGGIPLCLHSAAIATGLICSKLKN